MASDNGEEILALVSGYSQGLSRLLLMLQAYIDDSKQSPVYVLAGFISHADRWMEFSKDWADILSVKPSLEYFKMSEAANLSGQFDGWDEKLRDERVEWLANIIRKHTMLGLRSIMSISAYKRIFTGKIARGMDTPYQLSYDGIIAGFIKYQHLVNWNEPVDFIFDEQGKESDRAQAAWPAFISTAPESAKKLIGGRPIHRDDKKVLPLQAADMLAWITRRQCGNIEAGKGDQEVLGAKSIASIPCITEEWGEERLRMIYDMIRENQRKAGTKFPYDA